MDSFSFGVVLWELITRERTERGNWRPVRVPEECPAEVDALLMVRSLCPSLTLRLQNCIANVVWSFPKEPYDNDCEGVAA